MSPNNPARTGVGSFPFLLDGATFLALMRSDGFSATRLKNARAVLRYSPDTLI